MKKNNYGKASLLLMSAIMAFSVNTAIAAEPITDPTVIPTGTSDTVIDNTSVVNNPVKEYYSNDFGGGIYHVKEDGTLNMNTNSSTKTYSGIASMIELTIKTAPADGSMAVGDIYKAGRIGGVIYNAGNLTIGDAIDTAAATVFSNNLAGEGGVIANYGTASIYHAQFQGNEARLYSAGNGAAFNESSDLSIWNTATSGRGGAITNFNLLEVGSSQFLDNKAGNFGGAIYNGAGGEVSISDSTFNGNTAGNNGGAIYNSVTNSSTASAMVSIIGDSVFQGNSSAAAGGAIYSTSTHDRQNDNIGSFVLIDGASFLNNVSDMGGAIFNDSLNFQKYNSTLDIENAKFTSNGILSNPDDTVTLTSSGGAVYNSGIFIASNVDFDSNIAMDEGGAIRNSGSAYIGNSTFENNGGINREVNATTGQTITTGYGGAIYNTDGYEIPAELEIANTTFRNNSAASGGAIYNSSKMIVTNSNFEGNTAVNYGGAIYNSGEATIIDSTFYNNGATAAGGAIYGAANSETTLIAQNRNMDFTGGINDNSNTIHLATGSDSSNAAILNLNAHANRSIDINTKVSANVTATDAYVPVVNINYNSADYTGNVNFNTAHENLKFNVYNGTANFNEKVSNSTVATRGGEAKFINDMYLGTVETKADGHLLNNVVLDGGTLNIQNGVVSNIALNSVQLLSDTNLKVDVDIVKETMDNISQTNMTNPALNQFVDGAKINISSMNIIDESEHKHSATIFFTDVDGLSVNNVDSISKVNGRIYQYNVNKVAGSSLNLSGSAADDVYFNFSQTNTPADPVTPKPMAQLGAFLLMDNIYRQSFANMDMLSILTRDERETLKRYNRYSNMFDDEINTFYRDKRQEDYPSVFVRGFTNLEHVQMKRGPRVSNVTYGTLIGHESGLYELGRGWDANYAVFGAYTGAHQTYNGIGVWQNGGAVGGVFTAYKGDFWTGITANVGGWAVEAGTDFGNEHFPLLGTGVAMKTGYNWRLFDNKFIIQPSYMMSYSFLYAYSHDNAAGVHIKQDPMHTMEFVPGVKLIANNFRNGWQPYLAVNMTWMCIDGGRFWADTAAFDTYTIRPFVEYGIGVQKHHGERSTGYLQAMVRNGGRTGVALTGGFRYAIGEDILD